MNRRINNTHELQREIEALLESSGTDAAAALDAVAEKLFSGRPYSAVAIYVSAGKQNAREGERPAAHTAEREMKCTVTAGSKIKIPIEIGSVTLGMLQAESERSNAFGYGEQVFLKQTARALALYLSVKGKALRRKLREAAAAEGSPAKLQPEPERAAGRRAAAGETSHPAKRAVGASGPRA